MKQKAQLLQIMFNAMDMIVYLLKLPERQDQLIDVYVKSYDMCKRFLDEED